MNFTLIQLIIYIGRLAFDASLISLTNKLNLFNKLNRFVFCKYYLFKLDSKKEEHNKTKGNHKKHNQQDQNKKHKESYNHSKSSFLL